MATIIFTFLLLAVEFALAIPTGQAETRQSEIELNDFKPRANSDPSCVGWTKASEGDSCFTLYSRAGISNSFEEFLSWNPELQTDCNAVAPGYSYCVSAPPPPPSTQLRRRSPQSQRTTDFPPVPPQLKCISKSSAPTARTSGLFNVVAFGCGIILASPVEGKFLEKGAPYVAKLPSESEKKWVSIEVQIKKGGFKLQRLECERWLAYVIYGCDDGSGRNKGGCMYSADYNLEGCIFPYDK